MLSEILDLGEKGEEEAFDFLYPLFCRDFVERDTYLNDSIYVDPRGQGIRDGREEVFWHVTTREKKKRVKEGKLYKDIVTRPLDPDRASRICWIRPILENITHDHVRLFYRKETKGKKPIRLYLWAYHHDFVVIVQKLGRSDSFLVTSFYITEEYKRESYAKWYRIYSEGTNEELNGCEWF